MNGDICPECGAVQQDDRRCRQIFEEFLALEFTNAGFGEVHFLTVACFMIQHRRYSDEGLKWIETKLRDYLENGLSADEIRRQANKETSQETRKWKVTRQPGERILSPVAWSKRITDVKFSDQDAAGYRQEITAWARATLDGMQAWINS